MKPVDEIKDVKNGRELMECIAWRILTASIVADVRLR